MKIKTKSDIIALLRNDLTRWRAFGYVEKLGLPNGCIAAGFIRNLVWDYLHGKKSDCKAHDLDVLYYEPNKVAGSHDQAIEDELKIAHPDFKWSVKNQARMHTQNNDEPYTSIEAAMLSWPETATAIAAHREGEQCVITAPFGLNDLITMTLRPTSKRPNKMEAFNKRCEEKRWMSRWPKIIIVD